MKKLFVYANILGFRAFLFAFKIAFRVARIFWAPARWALMVLAGLSWFLPETKPSFKKDGNPVGGIVKFVDKRIFKTKELESEKWSRENGCTDEEILAAIKANKAA